MTFSHIADLLIPGYTTLSQKRKKKFEQSEAGIKFRNLTNKILANQQKLQETTGWLDFFTGKAEHKKQLFSEKVHRQKNRFIDQISHTPEYQTINRRITYHLLKAYFPEFNLLRKKQKKLLASMTFSQELLRQIPAIDALIQQKENQLSNMSYWEKTQVQGRCQLDEIEQLQAQKKVIINEWNELFLLCNAMASSRNLIAKKKKALRKKVLAQKLADLEKHARQLAVYFPMLDYRLPHTKQPFVDRIITLYKSQKRKALSQSNRIDETLLAELLFYCMQRLNQIEAGFINLDNFNKNQAQRMSLAILENYRVNTILNLDMLLAEYQVKLTKHLIDHLSLANHPAWPFSKHRQPDELVHALSCLWNNKTTDKMHEFVGRIADAHAFIQATGFSTQNESSFLAILDIYNYNRYNRQIAETKTIAAHLLSPLQVLYDEYKDIALYEKNGYWKTFRMAMPILIILGFIILVAIAFALIPLALPELVFTATTIAAFFFGTALAIKYISTKNQIYKYCRNQYYGGAFEIPEFQVNDRMISAFGNQEHANWIRNYYIDELKRCDKIETDYQTKHIQGLMTQEDIESRKENIKKRHQLCLEWYDIHSNKDLGFETVAKIAQRRLQNAIAEEYQTLKSVLTEELDTLDLITSQITDDLKATINEHATAPTQNATRIKIKYTPGFFSPPRSLPHKKHIEEMVTIHEQLSPV